MMMMMCWWLVDSTTLAQHLVESNLELRLISPLKKFKGAPGRSASVFLYLEERNKQKSSQLGLQSVES
jgi:hypothetical protein